MAADLRGASADALDVLGRHLDGVGGDDAATAGEDLFGVATLLRGEPALRRVATDVATDAAAKSGLMRSMLDGKVSSTALEVVAAAAERRWTRTRDLADVLELLGVRAVVQSAGDDVGRLADELFAVRRMVDGEAELRGALSDPARNAADKGELLEQLLAEHTLPATRRLTRQSVAGSYRTVPLALEAYEKIAAEAYGRRVATVRVAQPLTDAELQRLQTALSRSYDREVHLDVVVDARLLGGMRVEIGDDVIDGTVSGRLDEAHRLLAG